MQALIEHLLQPILQHPADMKLNVIEGKASLLIELQVHDDDVEIVCGQNNSRLQAIRHILSIASGKRKPSLELITGDDMASEESAPEESAPEESASEESASEESAPEESAPEEAASEESAE